MRYLTLAPLALAAAVGFASIAQADEYQTALNKEAYAVAAQSAPISAPTAPLAYATPARNANPLSNVPAPQPTSADELTFKIGDRGIGSN